MKGWRMALWLGAIGAVMATDDAAAQAVNTVPRPGWTDVDVRRASSEINLDARLDEPAWEDAEPIALPWEIGPRINVDTEFETDCRLTYDDTRLYFGCRVHDPDPASIRAFLVDRDATDGQDEVGIVIDPFRDFRRGFGFNVNALGVQKDWVYDRGEGNDAWDAIWDSRGRLTDSGYEIEAAIPFASLRFPATADAQSWGFYIWRIRPRSESVSTRSVPSDPSNQCALCQMAEVRGLRIDGGGLGLEVAPYVTVQRTDRRPSSIGTRFETGSLLDQYGVDARWSVSSDVTANVTLNPDFSQVEADAPQLESNQQFALFFPERRPFFLEGAELFETPFRAVFTRTIADPSVGAKLSGKSGSWAFGALAARDERTSLLFPGPQSSRSTTLSMENTALIVRGRRDVGEASTVGALVTARGGEGGYENVVGGLDARVWLHPTTSLTGQVLRSRTAYPAEVVDAFGQPGTLDGWAARTELRVANRDGELNVLLSHIDPRFRADGGFVTEADMQRLDIRGGRDFWMDDHPWLTRWRAFGGGGRFQEADGTLIGQFVFSSFGVFGPWQSEFSLNPDLFEREFRGQRFVIERLNAFGNAQPTSWLGGNIFWQFGRELDFANARESELLRLQQGLDLRLGPAIEAELDYDYKRIALRGQRVFTEQVAQARLLYHFSTRFFVRALLQARDVDRDPALYLSPVDRESRGLDTQFLLSYKLDPQSVFFLGYSDRSAGLRENEDPLRSLDLTRLTRSFFLKVSYAWRP